MYYKVSAKDTRPKATDFSSFLFIVNFDQVQHNYRWINLNSEQVFAY